jgi:acetyl-CoA C-acetyltransferase
MFERKVAIVGYALSDQADRIEDTREGLIFDTVRAALAQAGITRDQIGTVVMCSNDFYDGHTISNAFTVEPAAAYAKDETKVEQDGMHALLYAAMRLASGNYDVALVVAHSKGSEFEAQVALSAQLDPTYDRQFGWFNDISMAAFQARAFLDKKKLPEEVLAQVAAKNFANARKNPKAKARDYSAAAEAIARSKPLFTPLREQTVYPVTDGCCVAVLAAEPKARKMKNKPIWIKGIGHWQEAYALSERDLTKIESAKKAAKRAYKMAGVTQPAAEIKVAELSEMFAHQELMLAEALGLCEGTSAAKNLEAGRFGLKGKLPINPSGGALAACALGTVGLVRAVEAAQQVLGEAGEHQVKGVKLALAHGQCGPAAQNNVVAVFGK